MDYCATHSPVSGGRPFPLGTQSVARPSRCSVAEPLWCCRPTSRQSKEPNGASAQRSCAQHLVLLSCRCASGQILGARMSCCRPGGERRRDGLNIGTCSLWLRCGEPMHCWVAVSLWHQRQNLWFSITMNSQPGHNKLHQAGKCCSRGTHRWIAGRRCM